MKMKDILGNFRHARTSNKIGFKNSAAPEPSMRTKSIIETYDETDATNPEKIKADVARIMARKPSGLTIEELPIMYSDEAEELELARQRLELRRLEAEVEETLAAAAKDRAEADRRRRSGP